MVASLSPSRRYRSPAFLSGIALPTRSKRYYPSAPCFSCPQSSLNWSRAGDCDLVVPASRTPVALVHFMGGFAFGNSPRALYFRFLNLLAERANAAVLALPFGAGMDHSRIAIEAGITYSNALSSLPTSLSSLPCIGAGHSLGAKVLVLGSSSPSNSLSKVSGNALIAFNNFPASRAVPLWARVRGWAASDAANIGLRRAGEALDAAASFLGGLDSSAAGDLLGTAQKLRGLAEKGIEGVRKGEFSPAPHEVAGIVQGGYVIRKNLVMRFREDDLDCSAEITEALKGNGCGVLERSLDGGHLCIMAPDTGGGVWKTGYVQIDDILQGADEKAKRQLEKAVVVLAAFIKLIAEERGGNASAGAVG